MTSTFKKLATNALMYSVRCVGVLDTANAILFHKYHKKIITVTSDKDKVFFYTDSHMYGYQVLPDHFVPCSSQLPKTITPREGFEDGLITTVEQYQKLFYDGYKQITTLKELAKHLDDETMSLDGCVAAEETPEELESIQYHIDKAIAEMQMEFAKPTVYSICGNMDQIQKYPDLTNFVWTQWHETKMPNRIVTRMTSEDEAIALYQLMKGRDMVALKSWL